jgi:hypothetical protein
VTPVDHRRPPDRARSQHTARKPQRAHSTIGAAIVAVAAMVAVVAFILTRGTSAPPERGDGLRVSAVPDGGAGAPAAPAESSDGIATKADRRPAASTAAPKATKTTPVFNTGVASPTFKGGQWIAVLDKYPTDVGMDADQLAKNQAIRLIRAGVPAKAMLVNGQYPGITNSSIEPIIGTWVVYLGPGRSSEQMLDVCLAPKTQSAFSSPCPTYQPAVAPG